MIFVSFLLVPPHSKATPDTSTEGPPQSRIGIVNDTPNFQLEVTIDEAGPFTVDPKKAERFVLNDRNVIGEHRLVAKAYVSTKHLGRRQIGKECTIIFEITGQAEDSPIGKVGWYNIFTFRDFLPQLACFPAQGYRKTMPKGAIMFKRKPLSKCHQSWKKDCIYRLIRWASEKYRIPATLLTAIVEVESGFNSQAISRKGALGLMQLMPETCRRFSVQRPFDPRQNVEGGAKYLSHLLYQWSLRFPPYQRLELSLAAYNAGEEKVEFYGGIPPFKETKNYIREVLERCGSCDKYLGYIKLPTCSP